ncbi:MAG: helix-turn-helix domain-containing protein [Opitutales bacterium]|nr:helix-turn-helix domain-containing protein [Opitutales bacterium]
MIGEKLEEARKRKGISIREAADATKIRGEYLMAMENNSMDINLPTIYIRGFLKNYARFLNLDENKILTDFDARQLGRSNFSAERDTLGRMEVPPVLDEEEEFEGEPEEAESEEPESSFKAKHSPFDESKKPPRGLINKATSRKQLERISANKDLYIKAGLLVGGTVSLIVILVLLIRVIIGGDSAADETAADTARETRTEAPARYEPIVLRATDTVTVIVEQTIDRERLYSGTLEAGQPLSLERQGPVSIRFTNGSALTIERGDEQFRPNQSGVGRTVID